ncbi:MAG: TIGR04211 family SH3 domain-containing protein [Methylohalobius sp.]|nr:TIGR04211 family SH3 domain-containing protein [Methylohalobius sp.]
MIVLAYRQGALQMLLLSLALAFSLAAAEEASYVTNTKEVHLRAGQGTEYKILRLLPSGTPLTLIEHDTKSGYSKVRLRDGTVGWVLTRHISDERSCRIQLQSLSDKIQTLTMENNRLAQELSNLQNQKNTLSAEHSALAERANQLAIELNRIRAISGNTLAIEDERNQLRERVIALERDLNQLKLENQTLSQEQSQRWFLIGAGVLGGGILAGLILPRLTWRRRHSWSSF